MLAVGCCVEFWACTSTMRDFIPELLILKWYYTDLKNNIVQTALASTKAQHNALV